MNEEKIEQTYPVKLPARLAIGNIRGSIVVQPADDLGPGEGQISVTAIKYTDTGDAELTRIEIVQAADGSVQVSTHFDQPSSGYLSWLFSLGKKLPCKVDYKVTAPRSCSVSIDCVSSSASVEGLQGQFNLKTVSGKLEMHRLEGPVDANTVSGRMLGQALVGPVDLHTVSGTIEILGSNLASIKATSVSGRMDLETVPLGAGPHQIQSVSGEVRLAIPPGTGCRVETHRVSGKLRTDFPVTVHQRTSSGETVEILGGGPLIRFNTTSGNLDLIAAEGAQPAAAPVSASAETTPAEHRRQVLERIAQGELSAEEGLKEL